MSGSCEVYKDVSGPEFVMGLVLAVAIIFSYVPQHMKIFKRRSSEGLSPIYLFFGSISAFSAFLNVVIVTIPARWCCSSELSVYQCANAHIGFTQIMSQTVGMSLVLILCVYITRDSLIEYVGDFKRLVSYYHWFCFYAVFSSILVVVLAFTNSYDLLNACADILGLVSTVVSLIQYFPQLKTTYLIKHSGTLSIPMMLMQTPGGFFWTYSLYKQPNSKWSTYLPFLSGAVLQGLLLTLCLYYNFTRDTTLDELNSNVAILNENLRQRVSHDEEAPLAS